MGILSSIADLFFPPKCIFCGKPLPKPDRGGRVCRGCRRTLPYNEELIPPKDGMSRVCAPLIYRDGVRDALRQFKFHGHSDYAAPLGKFIADEVRRRFAGQYDLITWAPISAARMAQRRYDQGMLLAEAAALELGDVAVSVLEKVRDNPPNSSLGAKQRGENVRDAYRATAPELVSGKRVLLIDDIYTTGATMGECARVLAEAGALQVLGAAVARAGVEK